MQTSALDAHTEAKVMENINSILFEKARTSIFIAHRLRSIADAGLSICCVAPTLTNHIVRHNYCVK